MSINKKWKRIDLDLCPLCSEYPETILHLLSCKQQDITTLRISLSQNFFRILNESNTQRQMIAHWKDIFHNMTHQVPITTPKLTMNPISWTLIQAHQSQSKIGWGSFVIGLISKKWSHIQQKHYNDNPKDGENIYRWKRMVIRLFMDLFRELWQLRCKFIHAETTMTAREMLSHRTLQLYLENKQHTHLLPAIDRHLLDKEEKYFRSATKESLELWESRIKQALKKMDIHEKNQPCIPFAPIVTDRQVERAHIVIQKYNETDMTARLQVLDNFIRRARQLKRKHKIMNADPTWNKRLRLTHTGKIPQK